VGPGRCNQTSGFFSSWGLAALALEVYAPRVAWRRDSRGGVTRWAGRLALLAPLALAALGPLGCRRKGSEELASGDAGAVGPAGLSSAQAARVLAKVGERTITLGDYAATLERMDPFDRLRYQSAERRKELLEEMIDAELLADDARAQKLDQRPETQQAVRQILRDAILADAKKGLPPPANFSQDEVRAYYEAHPNDFQDPERRRVSHILFKDKNAATRVLALAKGSSAQDWGTLVAKYSSDPKAKAAPVPPVELAGDLGLVGPPGEPRGDNPRVPSAVRAAVFQLNAVGDVFPEVVEDTDGFHLVRLVSKSDARKRTLQEADRSIRVALLQLKLSEREAALEADLRKRFPVVVDEQALANLVVATADAGASHARATERPR
jgi:peptidyl-prolyl cis-trans isomerase C